MMDLNNSVKVCAWDNCLTQFLEYEDLYKHLKEVHVNSQNPSLPRDCRWANTCNYQTSEKKHLVSHLRSHLDWRPFSCELCDSRFKHEHEIRRHVDKLHKGPSESDYNSAKQISPHSFSNNVTSNDSFKGTSTSPTGMLYSESDLVLMEIVEFAFGFRPFLRMDDVMKSTILAMGLPLNVLEIPQHQIKRLIIDNLYQTLLISTYSNSNSTGIDSSTMGYTTSNYNFQPEYVPQVFNPNDLSMQYNQQTHLPHDNIYQTQNVMGQQFNGMNGNMYYSEQQTNHFQPVHSLGYDAQINANISAPFASYPMNFMSVDNLEGSTFVTTRSISNQGQSSETEVKSPSSKKSAGAENSPKSGASASPKDNQGDASKTPNSGSSVESADYSPLSKFGVTPLLNSILPSIKNFLTTSSPSTPVNTSPEVSKETSFEKDPELPVSSEISIQDIQSQLNLVKDESVDIISKETIELPKSSTGSSDSITIIQTLSVKKEELPEKPSTEDLVSQLQTLSI